jgi:RNA polymerase sigma-B factor
MPTLTRQDSSRSRGASRHGQGRASRDTLIEQNAALVVSTRRRLFPHLTGADADDCDGAGYVALVTAADNYDPARGFAFSTFAVATIRGALFKWYERVHQQKKRIGGVAVAPAFVPLDAPTGTQEGTAGTLADRVADPAGDASLPLLEKAGRERFWSVVAASVADRRQEDLLRLHYAEGLSLSQIAQRLGVSQAAASATHQRALKRLRGKLTLQ